MGYNVIAGTASITVDGASYALRGDFRYSPSIVKREALMGMDDMHGFKETRVPGFISCKISDSDGLVVGDVNRMKNVTVVAQLANGKTITGRNMSTVETQEVDSTEAATDVRWEGPEVIEE